MLSQSIQRVQQRLRNSSTIADAPSATTWTSRAVYATRRHFGSAPCRTQACKFPHPVPAANCPHPDHFCLISVTTLRSPPGSHNTHDVPPPAARQAPGTPSPAPRALQAPSSRAPKRPSASVQEGCLTLHRLGPSRNHDHLTSEPARSSPTQPRSHARHPTQEKKQARSGPPSRTPEPPPPMAHAGRQERRARGRRPTQENRGEG